MNNDTVAQLYAAIKALSDAQDALYNRLETLGTLYELTERRVKILEKSHQHDSTEIGVDN